jgi:hypothetical protein
MGTKNTLNIFQGGRCTMIRSPQCVSVIEEAWLTYENLLVEYCCLATKTELSDSDADYLDQILVRAEADELLSFLLNEIDCMIGQKLGLLNEFHVQKYKDQIAWLREYLELLRPADLENHRELQELLQAKGYYKGPVDGVLGKDFYTAVKEFQRSNALKADGIVGPRTILNLTSNSQTILRIAYRELANSSPPGG